MSLKNIATYIAAFAEYMFNAWQSHFVRKLIKKNIIQCLAAAQKPFQHQDVITQIFCLGATP